MDKKLKRAFYKAYYGDKAAILEVLEWFDSEGWSWVLNKLGPGHYHCNLQAPDGETPIEMVGYGTINSDKLRMFRGHGITTQDALLKAASLAMVDPMIRFGGKR